MAEESLSLLQISISHHSFAQAFEKLEAELEALIGNERLQGLSETFEPPPRHILSHETLGCLESSRARVEVEWTGSVGQGVLGVLHWDVGQVVHTATECNKPAW